MKKLAGVTKEEITIANITLKIRKKSLVSSVENFGDDIDVESSSEGEPKITSETLAGS